MVLTNLTYENGKIWVYGGSVLRCLPPLITPALSFVPMKVESSQSNLHSAPNFGVCIVFVSNTPISEPLVTSKYPYFSSLKRTDHFRSKLSRRKSAVAV